MADDPGRRALLQCGAACAFATACGKFVDEPLAIEAGAPVKNLLSVPVARLPELSQKGGSIILHVNASDESGRRIAVLVANTTSEGLRAYDAYCPHAGCELAWVDRQNQLVCPCHLSTFSVDGEPTHLPARAPVESHSAKITPDGATLIVDVGGAVLPAAVKGEVTFTAPQLPGLSQVAGSVTG